MNYRGKADLEAVRAFINAVPSFTRTDIARITGLSLNYASYIVKKYFPYATHKCIHPRRKLHRHTAAQVRNYAAKADRFSYKDLENIIGIPANNLWDWMYRYTPELLSNPKFTGKTRKTREQTPWDFKDQELEIFEREITGIVRDIHRKSVQIDSRFSTLYFIKMDTEYGMIDILTPGSRGLTPLEGAVSLKVLAVTYKGITRYKLMEILR